MRRAARRWLCVLLVALPAGARAEPPDPMIERTGDALQFGVPLVALGLTFLLDDAADSSEDLRALPPAGARFGLDAGWLHMNGSPRHDLALALGRTELATYSLKYGVDEQRPNGGGGSFPSGHTSVAFAGAEFIRKRYGWSIGVPAYLAAGFVGWSRVESHNHWTHDVLAGAAIGIFSNHDALAFHVPLGARGLDLTVAPTVMFGPGALGFAEQLPPGAEAIGQPPAPGLHFALRF